MRLMNDPTEPTSPIGIKGSERMTNLLPCPFCGTTPTLPGEWEFIQQPRNLWSIECDNCRCETGLTPNLDLAIELWNTRTDIKGAENE